MTRAVGRVCGGLAAGGAGPRRCPTGLAPAAERPGRLADGRCRQECCRETAAIAVPRGTVTRAHWGVRMPAVSRGPFKWRYAPEWKAIGYS